MPPDDSRPLKWDPLHTEVHVRGDVDCECFAYTTEFRERLARAMEDGRSGRTFQLSAEDVEQLGDGQLTIHDIHLREALLAFESAVPREIGVLI